RPLDDLVLDGGNREWALPRVLCCTAFSSVSALRSPASSAGPPPLFFGLSAPMPGPDFPPPFIIGFAPSPSRSKPTRFLPPGRRWDLPVPVQRASTHARFFDHAGSSRRSRLRARLYSLPPSQRRQHPGYESLRGSMAGLCAPLPTLRCRPSRRQRTARGRCGSLLLHRIGLAPPTPCRSPGALRVSHAQPHKVARRCPDLPRAAARGRVSRQSAGFFESGDDTLFTPGAPANFLKTSDEQFTHEPRCHAKLLGAICQTRQVSVEILC